MKCPKCNEEAIEIRGSYFCSHCGDKIDLDNVKKELEEKIEVAKKKAEETVANENSKAEEVKTDPVIIAQQGEDPFAKDDEKFKESYSDKLDKILGSVEKEVKKVAQKPTFGNKRVDNLAPIPSSAAKAPSTLEKEDPKEEVAQDTAEAKVPASASISDVPPANVTPVKKKEKNLKILLIAVIGLNALIIGAIIFLMVIG